MTTLDAIVAAVVVAWTGVACAATIAFFVSIDNVMKCFAKDRALRRRWEQWR